MTWIDRGGRAPPWEWNRPRTNVTRLCEGHRLCGAAEVIWEGRWPHCKAPGWGRGSTEEKSSQTGASKTQSPCNRLHGWVNSRIKHSGNFKSKIISLWCLIQWVILNVLLIKLHSTKWKHNEVLSTNICSGFEKCDFSELTWCDRWGLLSAHNDHPSRRRPVTRGDSVSPSF